MAAIKSALSSVLPSSVAPVPTVPLGKNGPAVPHLGIGLMGLSAFYGSPKPDPERLAFLDHLHSSGQNFWDSADMYADNEDLIGKWFSANPSKRSDIFLATKFANKTLPDGSRAVDSSPEYCREACEKSLKRLGVDTIDLYYAHRLDGKTPVEKTVEEMKKLKSEGKVRFLGLSECSAESLRRACKVEHIDAVQVEYSPWALEIEGAESGELLKACRELGVAVVAYSPLGRGLMTGKYKTIDDFEEGDFRRMAPRFQGENFAKNMVLVDRIGELASKKGVTPGQLTLAWLISQGDDIIPIPGTTSTERFKENMGALKVKLTEEEKKEIRNVSESAVISGGRYPEAFAKMQYSDTPAL